MRVANSLKYNTSVKGNTMKLRNNSSLLRYILFFAVCVGAMSVIAGCKKQSVDKPEEKRYHLIGKIVQIDQDQSMLVVDSKEIPGFMAAMTMPYPVRYKASLAGLGVGDEITADVVVASDGAYLDNIVVTKKGTGAPATTPPASQTIHQPQPGEAVPDFALVNQDGKPIHLSSYKGNVLLVTFIYTRCPFPDYCPLVSQNFAKVYAETKGTDLRERLRLLTISFDTDYDTPKVLRDYAATFDHLAGGNPIDRWQFAVAPPKDMKKITDFFGLYYTQNGGQITHSMSTSVISPQGKIYKWHDDNDWKPADIITEAQMALQQSTLETEFNFRVRG